MKKQTDNKSRRPIVKDLFVPACLDGYHPVPFVPRRKCLWCTNPECYLVRSLVDRSRILD